MKSKIDTINDLVYNLQKELNIATTKMKELTVEYLAQLEFDKEMNEMYHYFKNDEAILIEELKDYQDYIKFNGLETDYNNYIRSK